jgi:hypothetical protein
MADYTNYNHGSSNKGAIAALGVLAVLIIGILVLAANAPPVQEGAIPSDTGAAPAVAADPLAVPAGTD